MAAQTMNAASDEAEHMVQTMAINRFSGHYNSGTGNSARRSISGSSGGGGDGIRRLHSIRHYPQQARVQSGRYTARKSLAHCSFSLTNHGTENQPTSNLLFVTPQAQRQMLDVPGITSRALHEMTADGASDMYRKPLINLPPNNYTRQCDGAYDTSAGSKAVKRPLRSINATPHRAV
jgi:hypothetical protein